MALPAEVDLEAYRGDTWAQTFRFLEAGTPADLADPIVVQSQARSPFAGAVELPVALGAPGEVTIGPPPEGFECGAYEYDVEVRDNGNVTTWVRGTISVRGDVTNADAV